MVATESVSAPSQFIPHPLHKFRLKLLFLINVLEFLDLVWIVTG